MKSNEFDLLILGAGPAGSFAADAFWTGSANTFSVSNVIDTSGVNNPAPQSVYQSERWGTSTYTFPNLIPGSNYTARLHFAEISPSVTTNGNRQFHVIINGTQVLTNFDIFAAVGGKFRAIVREFITAADSARGVALVAQIRAALLVYRDVQAARADGYRQFLPGVTQPVYHFTSRFNALREMFRFDPTKPTSLLYRKRPDGSFELVGAMYADRAGATEDELNDRIPLALARWLTRNAPRPGRSIAIMFIMAPLIPG